MVTGHQWLNFVADVRLPAAGGRSNSCSFQIGRLGVPLPHPRTDRSLMVPNERVAEIVDLYSCFLLPSRRWANGASDPRIDPTATSAGCSFESRGLPPTQRGSAWLDVGAVRLRCGGTARPALGPTTICPGGKCEPEPPGPLRDLPPRGRVRLSILTAFWARPAATPRFWPAFLRRRPSRWSRSTTGRHSHSGGICAKTRRLVGVLLGCFHAIDTNKLFVTRDVGLPRMGPAGLFKHEWWPDAHVGDRELLSRVMDHFGLTADALLR